MRLEVVFPELTGTQYRITSPPTDRYNCIAWAVGDARNWWWPGPEGVTVWPATVPRVRTLEAFTATFVHLGFELCQAEDVEPDFEKVALFATSNGRPTHAARQLTNGRWTSKLGKSEDIEHDLHALEGDVYGQVVQIFRRPAPA